MGHWELPGWKYTSASTSIDRSTGDLAWFAMGQLAYDFGISNEDVRTGLAGVYECIIHGTLSLDIVVLITITGRLEFERRRCPPAWPMVTLCRRQEVERAAEGQFDPPACKWQILAALAKLELLHQCVVANTPFVNVFAAFNKGIVCSF